MKRVRTIHASSRQTHGAPRVHAELRARGEGHGRKRIARLVREAGLAGACHRHGGPTTTRRDREARPAPDLVDRDFAASAPSRPWVADITCVPTHAGFVPPHGASAMGTPVYLAVVLDAPSAKLRTGWSRRIVGWAERPKLRAMRSIVGKAAEGMANHLRAELVLDALGMAVGQRRPRDVIRHSDQGSQHASLAFGRRCSEAGVRPSMGSVGDACDNAMAESFFLHARSPFGEAQDRKLLARRRFASQAEARMARSSYIEGWYNPARLHSGLGYRSPIAYQPRCRPS